VAADKKGVRIVLDRDDDAEELVIYRGRLELEGTAVPIEVRIERAETPDGLRADAAAPEAPAELRAALERLAGAMARSAVRSARHEGRPCPRRIQRWRELPRHG
jgi:hypothetical protein